ncbi:MAG: bifunctional alpha/beta hydrolase/OsmC family protein [Oceanicaulis sp.]
MVITEKVEFEGASGDVLAARLERPKGPPLGWALFAHCFSCSKDVHAAQRISRRLTEHGFAVMRFDFTGLGQSEGDFANTNFSSNVQDLVTAAQWLAGAFEGPSLLVGHSLGGAAVIAAAPQIESVKAVATIGAPADADHVRKQFVSHIEEIEEKGFAHVKLAGRPFTIKKQFLDDIEGRSLDDIVHTLNAALLICHSPLDETVGIENATRLFVDAMHPKSFMSLDHADHLLSREADAYFAADVIGAWAARYAHTLNLPEPPEFAGDRCATVEETGLGGFHSWARVGRHQFIVDEPEHQKGLDGGPHPYQLLCASLAACTTMTLRMYANFKGYDFGRIATEVSHARDADTPGAASRDVFKRVVRTEKPQDEAMQVKILEIANKCPVHKTLERSSTIETRHGE